MAWRATSIASVVLLIATVLRASGQDVREFPAGRVGPYGGINSVDAARRMLDDGFTLAIIAGASADVRATLRQGGAGYIEVHLWSLVHEVCRQQFAAEQTAKQPLACAFSDADEDRTAAQITEYLRSVEADPGLTGFWILDDYPHGDIRGMLRRIHTLVEESNARSGFRRPTLCGVGGSLDSRRSVGDPVFTPNHGYSDLAFQNVVPAACDIVAPYFYGSAAADDPRLIDWSMGDMIKYLDRTLKARGYDGASSVLPFVHAFSAHGGQNYYVRPRPEDVAAQMQAYCEYGARSVGFFTWQSADADRSYANDASLRAGVQQGLAACTRLWKDRPAR